jgi:hypothetical protein
MAGGFEGQAAAHADAKELAALAGALREAEAIKTIASEAAEQILTACESLIAACEGETTDGLAGSAEAAAIEIMTACGFHDLVGQRATKLGRAIEALMADRLTQLPVEARLTEADSDQAVAQDWVDAFLAKPER